MDKAFFSENRILDLIPLGVLAVDRALVVLQCNPAACRMLGFRDPTEVIGAPVSSVMEEAAFLQLRDGDETRCSGAAALSGEETSLDCSFQCDAERSLFVCTMYGFTQGQQDEEQAPGSALRAAELADALCEKHLNMVSAIAGLLGETAVETQAAVQELKKALLPDQRNQNG